MSASKKEYQGGTLKIRREQDGGGWQLYLFNIDTQGCQWEKWGPRQSSLLALLESEHLRLYRAGATVEENIALDYWLSNA